MLPQSCFHKNSLVQRTLKQLPRTTIDPSESIRSTCPQASLGSHPSLERFEGCRSLAESLVRAGVRALEFTLTNASAPVAIQTCLDRIASFSNGTAAIGMGSVRNVAEARIAIECGSQFVVSPITSKPIIDFCKEHGVGVFPGAFSPTEIATAHEAGADIVKVFPSRNLGPSYIQDVLAPMPYLRLMPTGGVDLKNVANYFRAGAVAVGVGGQFLDAEAIARQDWPRIESLASQFVAACERE